MSGELRNAKTGVVTAKGRVWLSSDRRRGTMAAAVRMADYTSDPNEFFILALDSGDERRVAITTVSPMVGANRVGSRLVPTGGPTTEFIFLD